MTRVKDLLGVRLGRLVVARLDKVVSHHSSLRASAHWLCNCDCGVTISLPARRLVSGATKSCGCLRKEIAKHRMQQRGEKATAWKGGRKRQNGYVYVYAPEHPAARQRYVMEHRLVMEALLGRYLQPEETVHHKNGVRDDNQLENLELWSSNHPAGQRVQDLVSWAMDTIDKHLGVAVQLAKKDLATGDAAVANRSSEKDSVTNNEA